MSCERFRELITADPARADHGFERHLDECAACRAYLSRLLKAEVLIRKALRFDVAAARVNHRAARRRPESRRLAAVGAGLAVAVLAAATFWTWFSASPELTPEQLARAVAEHWHHEPEAWVTTAERIAGAAVADVLAGVAAIDLGGLEAISFAKICSIAGEPAPHLVVQGERGPIMLLLLPGRSLARPLPLELSDQGLAGEIVSAGAGSIAVLGGEPGETERMRELLRSSVEWII